MILSVVYLCDLGCQCYVHVSDTIIRYTIDECGWKGIIIEYIEANQWKIYNSKITKIDILSPICFDKGFNYYNTSCEVAKKDDNNNKLGDIWNKADNKKFSKVMTRRQVENKATFTHSTFQSQEEFIAADSNKKKDNNSFSKSVVNNNHLLPH